MGLWVTWIPDPLQLRQRITVPCLPPVLGRERERERERERMRKKRWERKDVPTTCLTEDFSLVLNVFGGTRIDIF